MILYAIPTPLGASPAESLPAPALETIRGLKNFAVENAKSARAFLGALGMPVRELNITPIDEAVLGQGPLGLLSEAGCPAIADPGASLIEAAHREGWRVVPLVGPSSLVLALMASGLEGQRFAFCGYLPRDPAERTKKIKALEGRSRKEKETEIFIETPYRNDALFAALLASCAPGTRLCVAADLTLPGENIRTRTVSEWKGAAGPGKRPAVFLLQATG